MLCGHESGNNDTISSGAASFQRVVLPLLVLITTVTGTLVLWRAACDFSDARARHDAERAVLDASSQLRDRFARCEQILETGGVLFRCSNAVTRQEWARFVDSMDLPGRLPGANGIAFVRAVKNEDLPAYLRRARAEVDPGFTLHGRDESEAPPDGGLHHIIEYHEPASRNASLWGLDAAADPDNRRAYEESMVSGRVGMTGVIDLAQCDENGKPVRGVVLALPIYQDGKTPANEKERRQQIFGWVAMSIDADAFLSSWWADAAFPGGCTITDVAQDGPSARVIHTQPAPDGQRAGVPVLSMPMAVCGRRWVLDVFSDQPITADRTAAELTLALGLVISTLLTGIVWSLANTRHRTVQLARKMTEHLRLSEERQRELAIQADQANRMKSLFLANMSHDVRTPMTAILGYSRLLEQELGDRASPLTVEALSAIRRSGDHLLGLINDVLDLSKIEAGRLELSPEPVETTDLIAGCIGIVRPRAEVKGVDLRVAFISPIPQRVSADPTRLQQIMLNLLGNAVKFTESGHVSLSLWSEPDAIFCFEIRDSGIGMSEEELARIFEPFVQADPSHTRRFGGTGLGLTIVKRIVEQMGGDITAESTTGVGTRFAVRLPITSLGEDTIDEIPQPGKAILKIEKPDDSVEQHTPCRVLVAEDGPDNQRLIAHVLTKAGHPFEIVGDGRSALAAIQNADEEGNPFDVVLLDMQMPQLDGYGVARAIRARGWAVHVIALTAHAMAGSREKCIEAGCNAYLSKPFDPRSLLAEIRAGAHHARAA